MKTEYASRSDQCIELETLLEWQHPTRLKNSVRWSCWSVRRRCSPRRPRRARRWPGHKFLSKAQQGYVRHYCEVLCNALDGTQNGDAIIDMDVVAGLPAPNAGAQC